MFEWIDSFATIADAERRADRAEDAARDAERYAKQCIEGERLRWQYENAHLRAVNEAMLKQIVAFAPPPVLIMDPQQVEDFMKLPAREIRPMTALEAAAGSPGWQWTEEDVRLMRELGQLRAISVDINKVEKG